MFKELLFCCTMNKNNPIAFNRFLLYLSLQFLNSQLYKQSTIFNLNSLKKINYYTYI
jgi:hypothetical protein